MDAVVRFRFNKHTGQVEEMRVDAVDSHLGGEEHNREHDELAAALYGLLASGLPQIEEILPGAEASPVEPLKLPPAPVEDPLREDPMCQSGS